MEIYFQLKRLLAVALCLLTVSCSGGSKSFKTQPAEIDQKEVYWHIGYIDNGPVFVKNYISKGLDIYLSDEHDRLHEILYDKQEGAHPLLIRDDVIILYARADSTIRAVDADGTTKATASIKTEPYGVALSKNRNTLFFGQLRKNGHLCILDLTTGVWQETAHKGKHPTAVGDSIYFEVGTVRAYIEIYKMAISDMGNPAAKPRRMFDRKMENLSADNTPPGESGGNLLFHEDGCYISSDSELLSVLIVDDKIAIYDLTTETLLQTFDNEYNYPFYDIKRKKMRYYNPTGLKLLD